MLLFKNNWPHHRLWFWLFILGTLGAGLWFFAAARGRADWPSGSSPPGFTFGVVGGLIIIFECLLWLRKKFRVWRVGRVQVWMRAHIWLGLLCFPLLILHSGFRLGGTLATVLMVLLVIVILSGIWGLVMQNILPRRMLEDIPAETIYSQIDRLSAMLTQEADQLVRATCGPDPDEKDSPLPGSDDAKTAGHLVVGAVRTVGSVKGKVMQTVAPPQPLAEAEALRGIYRSQVRPFLQKGSKLPSPLTSPGRSADLFGELKTKVPQGAHEVVGALEDFCNQRRQWEEQARLHFWLHNWLWIHLSLSASLLVLMFVHIWVALKYW